MDRVLRKYQTDETWRDRGRERGGPEPKDQVGATLRSVRKHMVRQRTGTRNRTRPGRKTSLKGVRNRPTESKKLQVNSKWRRFFNSDLGGKGAPSHGE